MEEEALFQQGQEVEVASAEQGYESSWYLANIIGLLSTNKDVYLVKHQILLYECVHVSNIRPPQPSSPHIGGFEKLEEVDAYFENGWWQGVIMDAHQNNMYTVYFPASNDMMKFGNSELRPRMEWVQGKWVKPQNKEKMKLVEVSCDDENSHGAWFPATLLKELGNNSFYVKHETMRCCGKENILEEIVNSRHIRPSPPNRSVCKKFDILQKVDAFYDFGWRSGVITRLLSKDRYTVFFEQQNKEKEFNQAELRLHMDWIDEKWIQDSGVALVEEQSESGVESSIPTGSTKMENHPSPNAVKDSLKRKSLSSPENSYQTMTPSLTNNPVSKIKLIPSRSSAEVSEIHQKLKKGVEANPVVMKACNERGTSTGNATTAETQHNIVNPILKYKRNKKSHHKRQRSSAPSTKDYIKKDHVSSTCHHEKGKDELELEGTSRRGMMDTIVPTESAEMVKHISEEHLTTSRRREVEHNNSGRERPEALASSIILLSEGSRIVDITAMVKSTDNHVPLSELHKLEFPTGENCGRLQSTLTSSVSDATTQGEYLALPQSLPTNHIDCAESQDHIAERHSMLLTKSGSPPTGENIGVSPENQIMASKAITREDVSMEIRKLQNSIVISEPSNSMDGRTVTAEQNSTRGDKQNETALQPFLTIATTSTSSSFPCKGYEGNLSQSLPFVKSSSLLPLWESFDSMRAFKSESQQPHFHGLEQYNKELREGIALGHMATFAKLMENTRTTTLDEPESSFAEKIGALDYLEELGFTVQPLRRMLQELQKAKGKYGQLQDVLKEDARKIIKEKHMIGKLEMHIDDLQKIITKINESLQSAKMEKEKKESNVAKLKRRGNDVRQSMEAVRHDFDCVVAAPW